LARNIKRLKTLILDLVYYGAREYIRILKRLYWEARFRIRDGVYGRLFFIATGFHGLHVLIGTKFLLVSASRLRGGRLSSRHHTGFEVAAWYWHFVDVVWLFLYIWVYV